MSAILVNLQAMQFCRSPVGIALHSVKSLRVLISGHRYFIIHWMGALGGVISLLSTLFCSVGIPPSILNHVLAGFWSQNLEGRIRRIPLLVCLFNISKMYFCHLEPMGVSESCPTRITGWSDPRVYCTNAVAIRCSWEHMGSPTTSLGALTTSLGAHWNTVE